MTKAKAKSTSIKAPKSTKSKKAPKKAQDKQSKPSVPQAGATDAPALPVSTATPPPSAGETTVTATTQVDPMPGGRHSIAWPHAEVTAKKFLPASANDYDGCWVVMGPYQRTPYVYLKATGWLSYPKHMEYESKHIGEKP